MRTFLLLLFCYWNVCCTGPVATKPVEPSTVYDKTVRLDLYDRTPPREIPWSEHASATIAPLISPISQAIKLFIP